MRHSLCCLALIGLITPLPALAQDGAARPDRLFSLPQGCDGLVTIQKRACVVTHLFTCVADTEGWLRRVDFDDSGMTYAGIIDAETQWIESWSPEAGIRETLSTGNTDPASFSTLVATGSDDFEFGTLSETAQGTVETIYRGRDILTGEEEVIDGVTLLVTEYSVGAYDEYGTEMWRVHGREFINPDWRSFISGQRTTVMASGEEWSSDNTPISFIFPGEAGYLSSTPRHECGDMISALPEAGLPVPALTGTGAPAAAVIVPVSFREE